MEFRIYLLFESIVCESAFIEFYDTHLFISPKNYKSQKNSKPSKNTKESIINDETSIESIVNNE